jgi:hypothetical protein
MQIFQKISPVLGALSFLVLSTSFEKASYQLPTLEMQLNKIVVIQKKEFFQTFKKHIFVLNIK